MWVAGAYENVISSFADFEKLSVLSLSLSNVNSSDSRKMNTFSKLQELIIIGTTIDLEGFNNRNLSYLSMLKSEFKNFSSLAECSSLKTISISDSVIDDSLIKNVMLSSGASKGNPLQFNYRYLHSQGLISFHEYDIISKAD